MNSLNLNITPQPPSGLQLRSIAYHRNGVFGRGFYAIAFRQVINRAWRNMLAIVFIAEGDESWAEPAACTGMIAVVDADLAAQAVLSRPENTWRGDAYEPQMRQWIARYQVEQDDQAAEAARAMAADKLRDPG